IRIAGYTSRSSEVYVQFHMDYGTLESFIQYYANKDYEVRPKSPLSDRERHRWENDKMGSAWKAHKSVVCRTMYKMESRTDVYGQAHVFILICYDDSSHADVYMQLWVN